MAHSLFFCVLLCFLGFGFAQILIQDTTPTVNATATAVSNSTQVVRQPVSYEYNVAVRVVSVLLLCCSGCIVTGFGWRERQKAARAAEKREQLMRLFVVKLDSNDLKLLGFAGYSVEACPTSASTANRSDGTEAELVPAGGVVKFAVIRRSRAKAERDALLRQARAMAQSSASADDSCTQLDIAIPPLPEFRLRIMQESGQCDVCSDAAAKDIVNLGGCVHTLCSLCASRVKICPFCRTPLVDATTGATAQIEPADAEAAQLRVQMLTQLSQSSSASITTPSAIASVAPAPFPIPFPPPLASTTISMLGTDAGRGRAGETMIRGDDLAAARAASVHAAAALQVRSVQ